MLEALFGGALEYCDSDLEDTFRTNWDRYLLSHTKPMFRIEVPCNEPGAAPAPPDAVQ